MLHVFKFNKNIQLLCAPHHRKKIKSIATHFIFYRLTNGSLKKCAIYEKIIDDYRQLGVYWCATRRSQCALVLASVPVLLAYIILLFLDGTRIYSYFRTIAKWNASNTNTYKYTNKTIGFGPYQRKISNISSVQKSNDMRMVSDHTAMHLIIAPMNLYYIRTFTHKHTQRHANECCLQNDRRSIQVYLCEPNTVYPFVCAIVFFVCSLHFSHLPFFEMYLEFY